MLLGALGMGLSLVGSAAADAPVPLIVGMALVAGA